MDFSARLADPGIAGPFAFDTSLGTDGVAFPASRSDSSASLPAWRGDGLRARDIGAGLNVPPAGANGMTAPGGVDETGGIFGLFAKLIAALGALVGQYAGESAAEGSGTQTVANGTFASTGDPHLSEKATLLSGSAPPSMVDKHFDSMTAHDNLLSSQDFDGGYRLSATVTVADGKGPTMNESATVHLNSGLDEIAMRNDGSVTITSGGEPVAIDAGHPVTLAGGATVTQNTDGSLVVLERNAFSGTIATTLAAASGGVNATAVVQNATVGGDIAAGVGDPAPPSAPARRFDLGHEGAAANGFG